jgi:mannose-1-phosphate guanylyltransferase
MKAVILVGGAATRLRPLTDNIPKSMVPVLNTPFLEYVIRQLSSHGIKDIILALSQSSQPIQSYFGDGSQFGVKLQAIIEDVPLGTAGAVKNAEKYLGECFLMLNGDIFTDLDITDMIAFHKARKAKATIALTPVEDPTSYGLVETSSTGRVTRFLEKPGQAQITTNMINAGTYILEHDTLNCISPHIKVSIEREVFPFLLDQGEPVYAYPSTAYWMDIGTPEKYLQLHRDLLNGSSVQHSPSASGEIVIGEQSSIDPTAQMKGAILIGSNCSIGCNVTLTGPVIIGPGCEILEDTTIETSIIWRNARLEPKVYLRDSILADNVRLNANSIVHGSVLGDNVTVVSGTKLESGSKISPGTIVKPKTRL